MSTTSEGTWSLIGGYRGAAVAHTLATTGIVDVLIDGPLLADAVSRPLQLDSVRTLQVLRAAAALGLLHHQVDGAFSLTPAGATLCSSAPDSLAGPARYFAGTSATAFTQLANSLVGGDSAFVRAHGALFYDYLETHTEVSDAYSELIFVDGLGDAIAHAWDFSSARSVIDVGGGQGRTLAELLQARPHLSASLVELPHVIAAADWLTNDDHLAPRVTIVEADFFAGVPDAADVYLLCRILPNWANDDAVRLLSSCRRAMRKESSLLVVDLEIPEIVQPGDFSVIGDLQAMAHFGGRLRTRFELASIIEAAGLEYVGSHEVRFSTNLTMVEAIRRDS